MHRAFPWLGLQFFAGEGASSGGDGGEGATAGVSAGTGAAADAGQEQTQTTQATDILEQLGVPKDKAEKYRARKGNAQPAAAVAAETPAVTAEPQEQAAAAEEPKPRDYDQEWKTIQDEPEFNRRMQDTVNKRVSKMKGQLDDLAPALEILGRKYGIDTSDLSKLDTKALSKAISDDDSYYEDLANKMGTDRETAKRIDQREREAARKEQEAKQSMQEQMIQQHVSKLQDQAAKLKAQIPGFDLQKELQDPWFRRVTSPSGGLSVEQAFYAKYHAQVEQARVADATQRAAKALSNSVQSGRSMPSENGTTVRAPSTVTAKPYSQMNKAERAEWLRQAKAGKKY